MNKFSVEYKRASDDSETQQVHRRAKLKVRIFAL